MLDLPGKQAVASQLRHVKPTSSSLSEVSESEDAVGLLTGGSFSSESLRFRLANDRSS